ncbi:hypothetical protein [Candidatus Regiella insecticola]|uniref:hypothetical protein n=1 Tax=Candidatus Regiella insecticola TaxID=138073 RepID=UPI0011455C26|nr:hypothetical protein [Candidatus Regiella insecticola]
MHHGTWHLRSSGFYKIVYYHALNYYHMLASAATPTNIPKGEYIKRGIFTEGNKEEFFAGINAIDSANRVTPL